MTRAAGFLGILIGVWAALSGCAHHSASSADPFGWLEGIEDPKALAWVKAHNDRSLGVLEHDARYHRNEQEIRKILLAKDRIPMPTYRGGYVYNFWQDEKSVRGLWRRTTLESYAKPHPDWQTVIDVDALAARDKENWVWKGVSCLPPEFERCVVSLSRGGKDAKVVREFDVRAGKFVAGGFELPEAKSEVDWVDRDTVLVGSDFGPDTLTVAGYPRLLKLWKRGQPLAQAPTVFEARKTDDEVSGGTYFSVGDRLSVVVRRPSFFTEETWILDPRTLALAKVEVPNDADLSDYFAGRLLFRLRSEWKTPAAVFPAGALVAVRKDDPKAAAPELVYAPDERGSIESVTASRDPLLVTVLENVRSQVLELKAPTKAAPAWMPSRLKLPDDGTLSIASANTFTDVVLTSYESFLNPTTLYQGRKVLKRLPRRFNAAGLVTEQLEAVSRDGTHVPYFVVHRKGLKLDGSHPTLLYGYGGFEIALTPQYAAVTGKVWLERGGIYALANIRGGGEFGPRWHQAALKENRQKAYDDFIAVSEDLVARKLTSPSKLGIMGGSNGGLLMGAVFTQRPELFGAVVCKVPLLDMLRYNQLLAGASWQGEYGDPAEAPLREAILKYSPYQNVKADLKYPRVFFETSTKDDRVHPGHARKMVARMEGLGHPVYYFENMEGGHGAAANLEQKIHMTALDYTYLSEELGVLY